MNSELLKKRVGYLVSGLPALVVVAGLIAPDNVEHAQTAFYLSAAHHAIPECILLSLLGLLFFLPQTIPSHVRSMVHLWRSSFDASGFDARYRKLLALLPFLVVVLAVIASIAPATSYARARYAYWFKEGLHREFQTEQLTQAFEHEAGYEYERAIRTYEDISKMFPDSKNTALLKERASLARGLTEYAEHMYILGKEEESRHGISRLALNLYLESLRVNPRHDESRRRLSRFQAELTTRIDNAAPFVEACFDQQRGLATKPHSQDIVPFLVDLPARERKAAISNAPALDLCTIATRFPNQATFMDTVKKSWQLERLTALMAYSDAVRDGKTMSDLLGEDVTIGDDGIIPIPVLDLPEAPEMTEEDKAEMNSIVAPALPPLPLPPR